MICPGCGKLARDGARFCDNCGVSLTGGCAAAARHVRPVGRRPDYPALETHLRQKGGAPREVRMTFAEIAGVVRAPLPPSSVNHRAWWGNEDPEVTMHAHKRAWGRAGYRVAQVYQHPTDGWVRFERRDR